MININRNNYEEYFIDYLDGNLSHSDKEIFLLFLDQNPDLKDELEMFEQNCLVADEVIYKGKESLKKQAILSDKRDIFDELCISALEGDLTDNEFQYFDALLEGNEEKQKTYNIYKLTKIEPDKAVVFENKQKLKRGEANVFRRFGFTITSVAASIIVLIVLYLFIPNNENKLDEQKIAESKEILNSNTPTQPKQTIHSETKIEKIESINNAKIITGQISNDTRLEKKLIDVGVQEEKTRNIINRHNHLEQLSPVDIKYSIKNNSDYLKLADVSVKEINGIEKNEEKQYTLKSYLASTFNRRVLNKQDKDRIELFDIAQAGVEGLNKLTGSNMKLERTLDKNGIPDKTEFNSRLIAFSAPVKKK